MRTKTWYESMGRFELRIASRDALGASHQGQCDNDVLALNKKPYIAKQLKALVPAIVREALREYGAWDETELSDHTENLQRILWLACCDIREGNI